MHDIAEAFKQIGMRFERMMEFSIVAVLLGAIVLLSALGGCAGPAKDEKRADPPKRAPCRFEVVEQQGDIDISNDRYNTYILRDKVTGRKYAMLVAPDGPAIAPLDDTPDLPKEAP